MRDPDRIYFSNLAVDPEFESNFEFDDLYDYDFDGNLNHSLNDSGYDESDEFYLDNI